MSVSINKHGSHIQIQSKYEICQKANHNTESLYNCNIKQLSLSYNTFNLITANAPLNKGRSRIWSALWLCASATHGAVLRAELDYRKRSALRGKKGREIKLIKFQTRTLTIYLLLIALLPLLLSLRRVRTSRQQSWAGAEHRASFPSSVHSSSSPQ